MVVPHAGTWIEIQSRTCQRCTLRVVPHAGTWIEMIDGIELSGIGESFPTRERGLK